MSGEHPDLVVMGASAGGGQALRKILQRLPAEYGVPVLVVQHLHPEDGGKFASHLAEEVSLPVSTPCDKEKIEPDNVYIAPAGYHMMVECTGHISLSLGEKVKSSRPSIDVLFESAAYACDGRVVAVLLTGANDDGTEGMRRVRELGGLTIVQDPATAEHPVMPQAAIKAGAVEKVLPLEKIAEYLGLINGMNQLSMGWRR